MRLHRTKTQKGFTLIEAVVASGLFAATVAIGVGMYLSIIRAQNEVTASRRASEDARYVMESIAREVRTGEIDYAQYLTAPGNPCPGTLAALVPGPGSLCSDVLYVIGNNDPTAKRNVTIKQDSNNRDLDETVNGSTQTTLNSTPNVLVSNVHFIIDPGEDPFGPFVSQPDNPQCTSIGSSNLPVRQPRVTILMDVTGTAPAAQELLHLQTTVTTKEYPCL